jgi:hypothetical protein
MLPSSRCTQSLTLELGGHWNIRRKRAVRWAAPEASDGASARSHARVHAGPLHPAHIATIQAQTLPTSP